MASDVTILGSRPVLSELKQNPLPNTSSHGAPVFLNECQSQAGTETAITRKTSVDPKTIPTRRQATVSSCSFSSLPLDVLERIVNYLTPKPWTNGVWTLVHHVRNVFPLTLLSKQFSLAVIRCSSTPQTSRQLLQHGMFYPSFGALERQITVEATRTAFAALRPPNESCQIPQLDMIAGHDDVCLMNRCLILMQVRKMSDLYIAWGPYQQCPYHANSQHQGHDLCNAVTVSYVPHPLKRLFVGNLTPFPTRRVAPVLACLLRAKHAALESIHVKLPCDAFKMALQDADVYLSNLKKVTLDGSDLCRTEDYEQIHDFFGPCSSFRLRSPCLSQVSVVFNHRTPPMMLPPESLSRSVKCLRLVNNTYDMDVFRFYSPLDSIEWENQVYDLTDLQQLGNGKKRCQIGAVSIRNCRVLFPSRQCKKREDNKGALIRQLYLRKEALLTNEGTEYLSKHVPNLRVLKVAMKPDVVPCLAVYINGLKYLRVLDLKVEFEHGKKRNSEWYEQVVAGLLGCDSPLEFIRVPNCRVTLPTLIRLMRHFEGSVHSLQLCLRRVYELGISLSWCYALRSDICEAITTARNHCRQLRTLCLQYRERYRQDEETEWMFEFCDDEEEYEYMCQSNNAGADEMNAIMDGFNEIAFHEGIEEWS